MPKTIQPSFAAGEVSPLLYGRVDLAKYRVGLKTMLNFYVHPQGGASNRAGTQWIGEVLDSSKLGRLIPFEFSTIQTYVLEFGDAQMRVIKDGGYVLETAKNITAATRANPCVVTSAGHGYSNGDRVYITGVLGMTQLNDRYFTVANVAANTFELSGVNSSAYTAYTSGGQVARVYTVTSPYALADLPLLKYEQSADTMTLTHPDYEPRYLIRSGHAKWLFSVISFAPSQKPIPSVSINVPGTAGYYAVTAINDATGEESVPCIVGTAGGAASLSWKPLPGCTMYSIYKTGAASTTTYGFFDNVKAPADGSTVTYGDTGAISPDFTITPPQARSPFAYGTITNLTIVGGSSYSAPTVAFYDGTGEGASATLTVSAGAITGFTSLVAGKNYSSQAYALITDGTGSGCILQPQWTDDGSGAGTSYISGVTIVAGGSGYAANAYATLIYGGVPNYGGYRIAITVTAGVVTAASVSTTGIGAWSINDQAQVEIKVNDSAGTGGSVTPVVTQVTQESPGCATYHDGRQWFAASNSRPQTMWASVSGAFSNMSVSTPTRDSDAITRTLASRQVNAIKHMVGLTNMIVLTSGAEWKVSAGSADVITPAQFVARPQSYNGSSDIRPVVVNSTLLYIPPSKKKVRTLQYEWGADTWTGADVTLLATHLFENYQITNWQYAKEPDSIIWGVRSDGTLLGFTYLQEQDVYAWHRHTTTNGTFEDVCVVREGNESAVYFIIKRTINGQTKRYVERLHTRVFTTLSSAWFLDCAKEINTSGATVDGLWHLIGEEVYALADGIVRGPYTVNASGQITLPATASYKIVGKLFPSCDLETLPIEWQDGEGTMQGRKKRIDRVMVRLKNSANTGISLASTGGQGTATYYAMKSKDLVNPLGTAPSSNPALITEDMQTIPAPSIDWAGTVLVRQSQPLPITVTAIMPDVSAGS